MAENLGGIIALEWLAAAQGVDFHLPAEPAAPLAEAVRRLRTEVPRLDQDRYFAPDFAAAKRLLHATVLGDLAGAPLFDDMAA
jgi:histidine ammonia-lyase